MGVRESKLFPSLGMSHLTAFPVPYFHEMLKSSDPSKGCGISRGT